MGVLAKKPYVENLYKMINILQVKTTRDFVNLKLRILVSYLIIFLTHPR